MKLMIAALKPTTGNIHILLINISVQKGLNLMGPASVGHVGHVGYGRTMLTPFCVYRAILYRDSFQAVMP